MSTTTAPRPAAHRAPRNRQLRRGLTGAGLALAVTAPLTPLTLGIMAAPAQAAAAAPITGLKIKPLFKGSIWHFNYQAEASFNIYATQYNAGDVINFTLSPGYAPGWNADVPIMHTDGVTVMGTATRIDADNFKITLADGVDQFSDSSIDVVLPIKYDFGGDTSEGLKVNGYNELNLTVDGQLVKSGSSFYFQTTKPFKNASLLYATHQPSDGNIRMLAKVEFNKTNVTGPITATVETDGNWKVDCDNPINTIVSDTDITDNMGWQGPELSSKATIVSCTDNKLVVRVSEVPAGYGVQVHVNGWATKTADTYRHYGSTLNAAGQSAGPFTSTARPGVPLGTGNGSTDVTAGTVFWDSNQNGWRDPGEDITFSGATIAFSGIRDPKMSYLGYDPEAKTGHLTTDANGNYVSNYSFNDLGYYIYIEDAGPKSHPNWRSTTGKRLKRTGTNGGDVNSRVDFGVYAPPVVTVEKNADGANFGGSLVSGSTVNWTYTVANAGFVDLKDLQVTDDQGVVVTCPVTVLAVGDSTTCTGSGKVTPNTEAMPVREDKSYTGNDAELVPADPVSAFAVVDPIKPKYDSLGGSQWALATADMITGGPSNSTTQEFMVPDSTGRTYAIVHTPENGAWVIDRNSALGQHFFSNGAVATFGGPTMDETIAGTDPIDQYGSNADSDRNWYYQDFRAGTNVTTIVTGAGGGIVGYVRQWGAVGQEWLTNGKFDGPWGYPTTQGTSVVTGGWSQGFRNKDGRDLTVSYSSAYGNKMIIPAGDDVAGRIGKQWAMTGRFDGPGVAKTEVILTDRGGYQDFVRNGVTTRISYTNGDAGAVSGTPGSETPHVVLNSPIGEKWTALGGSSWAQPTSNVVENADGGMHQDFKSASGATFRIFWSETSGAAMLATSGSQMWSYFVNNGGTGTFGYPKTDRLSHTNGYYIDFMKGTTPSTITWTSASGAKAIGPGGDMAAKWRADGGVDGLGLATTEKLSVTGGYTQEFINGTQKTMMTWKSGPTAKTIDLNSPIGVKWTEQGGITGLGFANGEVVQLSDGGSYQEFITSGGVINRIFWSQNTGAQVMLYSSGKFMEKIEANGGVETYGYPAADKVNTAGGAYQDFMRPDGKKFRMTYHGTASPDAQVIQTNGGIGARWLNNGGVTGYGFAKIDEVSLGGGRWYQDFWNSSTRVTTRVSYDNGTITITTL